MEVALNKIDKIKFRWSQLNNDGSKKKFIKLVADDLGKSTKTLRQWWFSNTGDWSIPEQHQDRVIELFEIFEKRLIAEKK